MSYSFRERLKMALKKKLAEQLGLTQEDVEYIKENIMKICPTSDEVAKVLRDYLGQNEKSLDEFIDSLTDPEFKDLVAEVLEIALKKLGYKIGQKKKVEEKPEEESEEESETDSDADTDSDSESEPEQEEEIACSEESK